MDTNVSLLHYIKTGKVTVDYEISKIEAGGDINLIVKRFFMNSPDYQKLSTEIESKANQLEQEQDPSKKTHLLSALKHLLEIEKNFKIDILKLAKVFSSLKTRTERLRKAVILFDEGRFVEADQILIETELYEDHFNLITLVDYLENRQVSLLNKILRKHE
ncbi:MAG: hypothetical protein AAFO07_07665 [Bacteroidota bacterium]